MANKNNQSTKRQQPFFPPLATAKRAVPASRSTGNKVIVSLGSAQNFKGTFVGKCDDAVSSAVFSPDTRKVASASLDKIVRVWDTETGLIDMRGICDDAVWSVAFSPDGKYLASGSEDCKIRIWEIKTGKSLEIARRGSSIMFVSFSANGKHLYSYDNQSTFCIYDAKSGRIRHETKLRPMAISADGSIAVAATLVGSMGVYDTKTGQIRAQEKCPDGFVECAAFSPDCKSVAFGTMGLQAPSRKCHDFKTNPGAIGIWDIRMAKINILGNCDRMARCVAFSPDGTTIVSGSSDRTVRIWNIHTGQDSILDKCEHEVCSVSFSNDGKGIVAGSLDKTVRVWRE